MTIELTEKPTDAERLHLALRCAGLVGAMLHDEPEYTQAAAEFAAPYLARITELESRSPANSCTNTEREQYERTIELQNARNAELDAALHALHKIGYDPTDEEAAQAWQDAGRVLGLKVAQ